jgi:hypothetical protein
MASRRIKVWLLDLPPLLADLVVSELGGDRELELMTCRKASARLHGVPADALLTTLRSAAVERLLRARPHMQAFVVGRGTHGVRRCYLELVQEELGELSLPELATAIKSTVGARRRRRW